MDNKVSKSFRIEFEVGFLHGAVRYYSSLSVARSCAKRYLLSCVKRGLDLCSSPYVCISRLDSSYHLHFIEYVEL